jgi:hypothetical protein
VSQVLGNQRWMHPWLLRASRNIDGIVYPVAVFLSAAALSLLVYARGGRRPGAARLADWLPIAPVLAGLAFWLFTAPDPRFANALVWLLAAASVLAFIRAAARRLTPRRGALVVLAAALAANAHFALWSAAHAPSLREVSLRGWQPLIAPRFTPVRTYSGLVVFTYTYTADGLIWDGPLPATPEFNPRLALRVPGAPQDGFTLR